jgi:hypothetical protein
VLCLVGGYLFGYLSGINSILKGAINSFYNGVNSIPGVGSTVNGVSATEWYIVIGLIFFIVGSILVVLNGGSSVHQPISKVKPTKPEKRKCKFCGSDMKANPIYCPKCKKSQI